MIEKQEHFESAGGEGVWLNREGKRIFIRELDKKVYQKQTTGKQTLSYDTRIRNEVCNILRYVLYEENYKPYKYY